MHKEKVPHHPVLTEAIIEQAEAYNLEPVPLREAVLDELGRLVAKEIAEKVFEAKKKAENGEAPLSLTF